MRKQRFSVSRGRSPGEKIYSWLQADLCSARILLLCKNEASVQPAQSVPLQGGCGAGLISLGFQVREGGLPRKEIIGPESRFIKRQGSRVMKKHVTELFTGFF